MEYLEYIFYIIFAIIYIAASVNGRNGRYSRNNPRLREQNDSLLDAYLDTSLDRIRNEYERRLKMYYEYNKPRVYLKNSYCELRLIKNENGIYIYCKERPSGNRKGRFFEISGNDEHASTMWGIFDMKFNEQSNYSSMRRLYFSLNSTNGVRYLEEPFFKKYPNANNDNIAQNEYCRMELQTSHNSGSYIVCTDIWSFSGKQFLIYGNKYLLLNIISRFADEKNKFVTHKELFERYAHTAGCEVRFVTQNTNTADEISENKDLPPEQTDFQQEPKQKIQTENKETEVEGKEENELNIPEKNDRFEERKLDL